MNDTAGQGDATDRHDAITRRGSQTGGLTGRIRAAARGVARFVPRRRPRYDLYVVGYPKVGNTWFQFMLRRAMMLHYGLSEDEMWHLLADEGPVPPGVPSVIVTHHMPRFNSEGYQEMVVDTRAVARRKLILLIRDPRDTLVSLYMNNRYRQVPPMFEGTLEEMIAFDRYGIEKYLKFYSAWHAARDLPREFLLVRYEDLKADTGRVMRAALPLAGIADVSEELLADVLDFGSFENMRRLENTRGTPLGALKKSSSGHPDAFKTRKGIVGGYEDYLQAETIAAIDRRVERDLPAAYGYHRHAD